MDNQSPRDAGSMEQHIAKLAAILEQHGLTHLEYETDQSRVVLDKENPPAYPVQAPLVTPLPVVAPMANQSAVATGDTGTAAAPAATSASAQATPSGENGELITAPLVGIAYSSKEPGAAPFVAVGDEVEEGTVLCLIEAMKMFNEVKAPTAGVITEVHFGDAELVEYGAPLFSLEKSAG